MLAGQREMERIRDDLRALSGEITSHRRAEIATYLRTCPIVIALMEYSRDVLDGAFGVSGGSAIHTDGLYYWRRDAADYVGRYGVGLPREFLERGDKLSWLPPSISKEEILDIDDYLVEHVRRLGPTK